jgi:hypothetical protein
MNKLGLAAGNGLYLSMPDQTAATTPDPDRYRHIVFDPIRTFYLYVDVLV